MGFQQSISTSLEAWLIPDHLATKAVQYRFLLSQWVTPMVNNCMPEQCLTSLWFGDARLCPPADHQDKGQTKPPTLFSPHATTHPPVPQQLWNKCKNTSFARKLVGRRTRREQKYDQIAYSFEPTLLLAHLLLLWAAAIKSFCKQFLFKLRSWRHHNWS